MTQLGVGFLGSGPVTQAIHIPFVSRFPQDLKIAHFMDVDGELAKKLGDLNSAKWSTDEDLLINDPDVSIVVVGSPNSHHARQIIKSCEARKRVVLAEKPLALTSSELEAIQNSAGVSGTQIVVGTMHAFDEAYLAALDFWRSLNCKVTSIDLKCFLPPNEEMISYATQLIAPTTPRNVSSNLPTSDRDQLEAGVLGLLMHDIPIVKEFLSENMTLVRGEFVSPWGYLIEGYSGDIAIRFLAQLPGAWEPDWSLQVDSLEASLCIDFQPSYVDAGSAVIEIKSSSGSRVFSNRKSPYESEWQEIIDIALHGKKPIYGLERIGQDLTFAFSLLNQLQKEIK